jgi:predicted Zn-dependent peptidase
MNETCCKGETKMTRSPMARFGRSFLIVVLVALVEAVNFSATSATATDTIPAHPDKLSFEALDYTPPKAADFRYTLQRGVTAYVAENHEVPTFQLSVLVRTGSLYESVDKAGIADMFAHLMRNGGIEGMSASEFDEQLAQLAAELTVSSSESMAMVQLFCLEKDADTALGLVTRMLRAPAFDEKALERYRTDVLSELEQRNSSTARIEEREWMLLMYGSHPATNQYRRTEESVRSITREDLLTFHQKFFFPKNFIFAVSGDFETEEVLTKLDAALADWPDRELDLPPVPDQVPEAEPGVYMIKKEDVNQSRIRLGHIGVRRDISDQYALMVMNDILGGGGFTSRIVRRVRSDEGLSYSAGSRFDRPVLYPGTFRAYFQTKHATAAFGTGLIVTEIERIRQELCSAEAVENAKASLIADVVNPFTTRNAIVNTFAQDDFTGRKDDYWQEYTDKLAAVTPEAVLEVAKKYLHPDRLVFLVVGDPKAVEVGSEKHPEHYSDFGKVTILPLRDPMSLQVKE